MCLAVTVFIFPQLGIHERLVAEKARICEELTHLLPSSSEIVGQASNNPEHVAGLLSTRARMQDMPEWPSGQLAQIRLLLYLLIPLMSWSAAALVEEFITRMLSS